MAWSSMTPRDRGALGRIVECLDAIDAYTTRVGPGWPDDGMAVDAIAKRIEEIGEVAKRIDVATLAHMAEIDWRALKGVREVLVHDYDEVDIEILVGVVHDNLPEVRTAVSRALSGEQNDGEI